ncbi:Uncharacterised protein (plasmid) [Legionella adelaidensis]|uniref:Uncharacterized protein n=1 Tax=Legionella adelaidensis TaxID=45056 RepID=A0A0W0R4F8_9GAMM|nr:hypothetical protein [Legionella adelaidensis]KTC65914.1 hypothetical protein Lade_0572 [Legionella adelaidensis]VEH85534.1 Uncharacterised protein [Legionella adelaidensis]
MSDLKSKLPDLKELGSMTSKLFKDLKSSVGEIIDDYKKKREQAEVEAKTTEVKTEAKPAEPAKTASTEPTPETAEKKQAQVVEEPPPATQEPPVPPTDVDKEA